MYSGFYSSKLGVEIGRGGFMFPQFLILFSLFILSFFLLQGESMSRV